GDAVISVIVADYLFKKFPAIAKRLLANQKEKVLYRTNHDSVLGANLIPTKLVQGEKGLELQTLNPLDLKTLLLAQLDNNESKAETYGMMAGNMTPVLGDVIDARNSLKYAKRGDFKEAWKAWGWSAFGTITFGLGSKLKGASKTAKIASKTLQYGGGAAQMGLMNLDVINNFQYKKILIK
nr:hypothetical protein [Candidatus Gracilibacteria bacterium]